MFIGVNKFRYKPSQEKYMNHGLFVSFHRSISNFFFLSAQRRNLPLTVSPVVEALGCPSHQEQSEVLAQFRQQLAELIHNLQSNMTST